MPVNLHKPFFLIVFPGNPIRMAPPDGATERMIPMADRRMWHEDETNSAKRYLMEYHALAQRRNALMEELEHFQEAATRATGRLSPVRPSGKPDNRGAREDAMLHVVDTEACLRQVIDHLAEALAARLALIEMLEDERQKTLLTLRYINGIGWEQIGYRMHYERTQVFAIHAGALEAVRVLMAEGVPPPLCRHG